MCKLLHVDIEAKSSLSVGVCHRAIVSNAIIGGGGVEGGPSCEPDVSVLGTVFPKRILLSSKIGVFAKKSITGVQYLKVDNKLM